MARWGWILSLVLLVVCGFLVQGRVVHSLGGDYAYAPEDAPLLLGPKARALIRQAYKGIGKDGVEDYGVHLIAVHSSEDGEVNPHLRSWWHPLKRLGFEVLLSAAGARDATRPDKVFVARLVRLARSLPGRMRLDLLALDGAYWPSGAPNPVRTRLVVRNRYAARVSARFPKLFKPVISINPHRPDAQKLLERWGAAGVRGVYWQPSTQGINPADLNLKPFYAAMKRYGLTLYVQTGRNTDLSAPGQQPYNNPLRLRLPLDMGVRVVMMSAGTLGRSHDLEKLGHPEVPTYRLCLRLLDDPRYKGLLFASLSGVFDSDRPLEGLSALLQRPDLASRLVYASNYPFSAQRHRISLNRFVRGGYLDAAQARALHRIYRFNPLLFNFVLARTVHLPHTRVQFAPTVFEPHAGLDKPSSAKASESDKQATKKKSGH